MSRLAGLFLAAALAGGVPACLADENPVGEPLTLDAAVSMALRDNPELASLRAKWAAMQERPAQAAALPNPMATFSAMDMTDGGNWPDTNEKRYMLEQEIPAFGKRGLREGIARQDAEALRSDVKAMALDVAMEVRENAFDLSAVRKSLSLILGEEQVLKRMESIAETLYANGARTQQDVIKAQAERTLLEQKRLEWEAREFTLKAALNRLLNRRAESPLSLAVPELPEGSEGDVQALFRQAEAARPEIQAAESLIVRSGFERDLMGKEGRPDFRLGVEYRDIARDDNMVMVSVGIELPVRGSRIRAGVLEAQHLVESGKAALEAVRQQVAFDVQVAHFKLRSARRTLELYRTDLIPQAEARFASSEAGYRAGKVDFMDLLESERFLLEARVMAAMAEGAVGMQAARLERAVGSGITGTEVGKGTNNPARTGSGAAL